ncbi:MAG TPA: imidazoleglycerol-phosphate dehydratase HisB [bacterium]|nr:imidazoleglycerol-phosphate dehydratase HisB [bacterium]
MAVKKKQKASVKRETRETRTQAELCLDGSGELSIKTPFGFMDHMLTAFAKHAVFDLSLTAVGDVAVDAHHTVEDIGLTLGEALAQALGEKAGIARFGGAQVPMDEALATAVVDISGRPYLVYDVNIPEHNQWEFDCALVKEFFLALTSAARMTLHLKLDYGDNYHHCCEAVFKAAGRAIRQAVAVDPRVKGVPSSKGTLK